MMSDQNLLREYLDEFATKVAAAGLGERTPGANWLALKPFTSGSHVSLSVSATKVQVNLNNDDDADRRKYDALWKERDQIQEELGSPLEWESKSGVKKTSVRAVMDEGYGGYEDRGSWARQHEWATSMMKAFEKSFGSRI